MISTLLLSLAALTATSLPAHTDGPTKVPPPEVSMVGVAPLDLDAPLAGMRLNAVPPLQGIPVTLDCNHCGPWVNIRVEDGAGNLIVLHQSAIFEVDTFDLPGFQQVDLITDATVKKPGECVENSEALCSQQSSCYWTIKFQLRWSVDADERVEPNDFFITLDGTHEPATTYTKEPGPYDFGTATHIVGSGEYVNAPVMCGSTRDVLEIEVFDEAAILSRTKLYRIEVTAGCSLCDTSAAPPADVEPGDPLPGGGN